MKALAGMLLAFALAAGISSEAGAQSRSKTKQVSKTSVKHQDGTVSKKLKSDDQVHCVCRADKSKMLQDDGLLVNTNLTSCVCSSGKTKTKHETGSEMMKTKTYGGYKPVIPLKNTVESDGTRVNTNRGMDYLFRPYVDSLNSNLR